MINCIFDVIKANPATFSVFGMMALNALSGSLLKPGEPWTISNIYKMFYNFFQLMISYKTGNHPPLDTPNPILPGTPANQVKK